MIPNAYGLRDFYKTFCGRIVRRVIIDALKNIWPSCHDFRILGAGYALPYLKSFDQNPERIICVMFKDAGVHHWPADQENLTCLADETDLPFETNSIDRIVLIHSLEFTGFFFYY